MKNVLKITFSVFIALSIFIGTFFAWWLMPISMQEPEIIKVIDPEMKDEDAIRFCNSFNMTPNEFREFWKNAKPIFQFESHDYSFGACHFRVIENDKEYKIGIGGIGIISNTNDASGDSLRYYVKKGAKSDGELMLEEMGKESPSK